MLVWRHVDKTGPEGNIDSLMLHGQGNIGIKIELSIIIVSHFLVSYILL